MGALDPIRADALASYAAAAARDTGSTRSYALMLRISESRARRHRNATDSHGAYVRVLKTFQLLATSRDVTPFPLLREAWAVLHQEAIRRASMDALHARLREMAREEPVLDAELRVAAIEADEQPDDQEALDRLVRAQALETDASIERLAILKELAERKRRGR